MKKYLSIIATILCFIIAAAGYHYATHRPTLFLPIDTDLSNPSRYVFLTETDNAAALVTDLQEATSIGRLQLATPAKLTQMDSKTATLYYTDDHTLTAQNLKNGDRQQHTLTTPPTELTITNRGLLLANPHSITLIDPVTLGTRQTLNLNGEYNTAHNRTLFNDWIATQNNPTAILTPQPDDTNLIVTPLPQYHHIGKTSLSPDGNILAFDAQDKDGKNFAVLWSLPEARALFTTPLTTTSLRPFIDTRSEHAYFVSTDGHALKIDIATLTLHPFITLMNPLDYTVGYLDTRLIVKNPTRVQIIDTSTLQPLNETNLTDSAGLFLTGDSKTVLVGHNQAPILTSIALKNGEQSQISLPSTIRPQALFMGASGVLCH